MRNKLVLLLIAIMLMLCLVACGNETATEAEPQTTEEPTVETTETTEEATEETTETTEETPVEVVCDTINLTVDNMRPILVEDDLCNVYFNSFGYANGKSVFKTYFLLENNSDMDISVTLTDVVVDGFDISTSQGKSLVGPGHKALCDSSVWEKDLEEAGITEWTYMEGVVVVRQDFFGETLFSIPVVIDKACWEYEETYSAENPVTVIEPSDLTTIPDNAIVLSSDNLNPTIIDSDGIVASIASYSYANGGSVFELNITVENNTDQEIGVLLTDVIVEGYEISTSQGNVVVDSGHKAICESSVWQKDLDPVGITDWIVLTGNIEIREGYFGDTLHTIPVVIYKSAWTATN